MEMIIPDGTCEGCEYHKIEDDTCDLTGENAKETVCHYEERKEMEYDILKEVIGLN